MSYEKFYPNGWQSGETGGTPITPEAMNHIENGIKQTYKDFAPAAESAEHPGCYYRTVNGVQEWINPPMAQGVEYRTTERYLGKAVYCKATNFGALPDSANKQVPHGISGKTDNLRFTIVSRNTSRLLTVAGITDVLADDTNIDIETDRSLSYAAVIFTLWYTKD